MAGLLVLFLSHGAFTLKPEVRYLAGIVLTGLITLAFLFPVVIYLGGDVGNMAADIRLPLTVRQHISWIGAARLGMHRHRASESTHRM